MDRTREEAIDEIMDSCGRKSEWDARADTQEAVARYWSVRKQWGIPIVTVNPDGTMKLEFSKEVDNTVLFNCPYCFYGKGRQGAMMKILHPEYSDGFFFADVAPPPAPADVDSAKWLAHYARLRGVAHACICVVKKDEEKARLEAKKHERKDSGNW